MNRRGFLKILGLAAPVAVVAPKYFFAPIGGWNSNVIAYAPASMLPNLQSTLSIYYEKRFVENLKYDTSRFLLTSWMGALPPPSGQTVALAEDWFDDDEDY